MRRAFHTGVDAFDAGLRSVARRHTILACSVRTGFDAVTEQAVVTLTVRRAFEADVRGFKAGLARIARRIGVLAGTLEAEFGTVAEHTVVALGMRGTFNAEISAFDAGFAARTGSITTQATAVPARLFTVAEQPVIAIRIEITTGACTGRFVTSLPVTAWWITGHTRSLEAEFATVAVDAVVTIGMRLATFAGVGAFVATALIGTRRRPVKALPVVAIFFAVTELAVTAIRITDTRTADIEDLIADKVGTRVFTRDTTVFGVALFLAIAEQPVITRIVIELMRAAGDAVTRIDRAGKAVFAGNLRTVEACAAAANRRAVTRAAAFAVAGIKALDTGVHPFVTKEITTVNRLPRHAPHARQARFGTVAEYTVVAIRGATADTTIGDTGFDAVTRIAVIALRVGTTILPGNVCPFPCPGRRTFHGHE